MVSKAANMDNTMLVIPRDSQHTSKLSFVPPQKLRLRFFLAVPPHRQTLEAAMVPLQSSMVRVNNTANNTKAMAKTRIILPNIREAM